jgi:hypothetical protein
MSSITPTIVHPEVSQSNIQQQKGSDEKSAGYIRDLNRSEGEGMGTSSFHNTVNRESGSNSGTTTPTNSDLRWRDAVKDERKLGDKLMQVGDRITAKLNETDAKLGFSKKFNEYDQKYGVTAKLEGTSRKFNDAAVHFGRALSRGQLKQAFLHSIDASRIAECERKKHDPKGLGAPAWIPESDKEGLVEGSVGKGPSPNEVFAQEEKILDMIQAEREKTAS